MVLLPQSSGNLITDHQINSIKQGLSLILFSNSLCQSFSYIRGKWKFIIVFKNSKLIHIVSQLPQFPTFTPYFTYRVSFLYFPATALYRFYFITLLYLLYYFTIFTLLHYYITLTLRQLMFIYIYIYIYIYMTLVA